MTGATANIITYISSKKQDIITPTLINDNRYSFEVLPFYMEWNGKKGEINQIEVRNDGIRYDGERGDKKNIEKYQEYAPDVTQTDAWSSGQVSISFAEPVVKAEINGQTLIIDGSHWVDMWRGIYLDHFELVEIIEDYNKGEDNKLILTIKERKITTSGFSPTINRLLINFGTTGAGMREYAAKLQVGKKYHFNGDRLENAKILSVKASNGPRNELDINNSANDIPEIRVFNEEGEVITHGPIVPTKGSKSPTNNQTPTNPELAKLKIIFQKLNIKKINFENGKLTIQFNNQQTNSIVTTTDNQEYQAIKEYCQEHNKKELTSQELNITSANTSTNSNPNKNQNNQQLVIGLLLGGGVVVLVGVLTYLIRKRKK